MLEILKSPLDCREIKLVNPKGNQPWIFTGRTDAEAEAPVLWPPDAKSQFTGKDPDAGKDWGQQEKRATEDEMTGWHHQLSEHDFKQFWEIVEDRKAWHAVVHGFAKTQTQLTDWTTTRIFNRYTNIKLLLNYMYLVNNTWNDHAIFPIVILYKYTRFWRKWSDGRNFEAKDQNRQSKEECNYLGNWKLFRIVNFC